MVLLLLRSLTLGSVVCLLIAPAAAAHLELRPLLLERGQVTFRVELPALRPGAPPTTLELRGEAVEQIGSRLLGRFGAETRWLLDVRVDAAPGPLRFALVAGFDDGATVEVQRTLTVVAHPVEARSRRKLLASGLGVTAGLGVVLLGVLVLHRRRRSG